MHVQSRKRPSQNEMSAPPLTGMAREQKRLAGVAQCWSHANAEAEAPRDVADVDGRGLCGSHNAPADTRAKAEVADGPCQLPLGNEPGSVVVGLVRYRCEPDAATPQPWLLEA